MAEDRNFFQRMFGLGVKPEIKQNSNMMGYFGVGAEAGKDYKYQDLAKEGYLKNAIVYRCVNEISKGASSVPFIIKIGDQILEEHPLIELLNRPNPLQSYSEFFSSLYGYLLLSGNSYVLKLGSELGAPKELHHLRPDRINIKGSGNPIPDRYDYMINGRVEQSFEVDQDTGFSELKHIKLWNPLDDYYGCSPLSAAATEVDQHNMAGKHNVNLLSNGARPSGAVIFKPRDEAGFAMNLTESQRQQLLTDLNNRFSGAGNAGRPMLLEGDFDWKEMGLSPKDMDFLNLKHLSATEIAMCFGVPSQLVGVPDAQTYANVAEARLALYEETIIPYLQKISSDLNEWLVPMFGDRLSLEFDIDSIPALSERRKKIYENVTSAVREGIMTRNEARERIGLEPVEGGDGLYIASNLFPLGDDAVAEPQDPLNEEDVAAVEDSDPQDDDDPDGKLFDEWLDMSKALSDIDTRPTESMANNAKRGLELRKKFNRGGTAVGVARANSLVARENLSISTIKRMFSFFSRHEVDKQGQGFNAGEEGYPSAGKIAWLLWGGDSGFSWAKRKRAEIEREEQKLFLYYEMEEKAEVSAAVKKGLQKKADDHNEKYGDNPTKKTSVRTLIAVFKRGVGAYRTNPSSVRPSVNSEEQWAFARCNSYLYALRNGKFRSGKHDTDLFPKGHPLSSKK
jgi:HK97 family phage portal protein|tara:strand:- start:10921 stop:12960 length:2040 start_codon:yes stop_codon:yes gene_type:complete